MWKEICQGIAEGVLFPCRASVSSKSPAAMIPAWWGVTLLTVGLLLALAWTATLLGAVTKTPAWTIGLLLASALLMVFITASRSVDFWQAWRAYRAMFEGIFSPSVQRWFVWARHGGDVAGILSIGWLAHALVRALMEMRGVHLHDAVRSILAIVFLLAVFGLCGYSWWQRRRTTRRQRQEEPAFMTAKEAVTHTGLDHSDALICGAMERQLQEPRRQASQLRSKLSNSIKTTTQASKKRRM